MELNNLLEKLADALEMKSISYMVVGGQAVLLYGEPRLTNDVDITVGIKFEELDKLLKISEGLNLSILVNNPYEFVRKNFVLPLNDNTTNLRIDFILAFTEFETQALGRAKEIFLEHRTVKYSSVEDLVIFKIFASRERDLEDAKKVILKNPDIDKPYIINWLNILSEGSENKFVEIFNSILTSIR